MLNRIKKNILPMLDTLGDALTQYLAQPAADLLGGITGFIDAINVPLADESKDAIALSNQLKASLKNPVLSEVERLYNEYCTVIEKLPVQYKAVFLPYYDNTWDSLASVYEAFAADPMFVTEIVIIPIRRNTPTGWKMIYEDYLTPKGIPNTHFLQYSFENDLPDFVFYNNPYDGVNIEKFQSQNIKPYVGCMVYIPYFLNLHLFYKKKEWLHQAMDNYTQLSGHDNADVFIAQGKSFMKDFAYKSRNGSKMAMLGSPKTDNIYKHTRDYPRYADWDKITKGKTVFMLNTHYTSIIKGDSKNFLPHLLEFIEQNKDLALIWRPHPQSFFMFEENDKSQAYLEWQGYIDRANSHERMILDRTANDISSIMYSNAVISHLSSVVSEAIFADKPVFILWKNPQEKMSPDELANITVEAYIKKLEQIRKPDKKNLFLPSAVSYFGLNRIASKDDITDEYRDKASMLEFMNDIRNGIDNKKELRALFCAQSFANPDGTCGQKIHDYIVRLIKP